MEIWPISQIQGIVHNVYLYVHFVYHFYLIKTPNILNSASLVSCKNSGGLTQLHCNALPTSLLDIWIFFPLEHQGYFHYKPYRFYGFHYNVNPQKFED